MSLVFQPNHRPSKSLYTHILVVYVAVILGGWLVLPSIIPSPLKVYTALVDLVTHVGLLQELWTSLSLNIHAIALSTVISLTIAYATAIPAFQPIGTIIAKGRFLSLIGLTFIFTVFIGGGYALKVALLTFGMTVFFVTSMVDVVAQVPDSDLDYARTLRYSEWRVLWEMRILGTIGQAFDTLRQNAAMGWLMLTMVEGIVRSGGGIGRMLLDEEKHFNLPAIFAVQLVFLLVGAGQDMFIRWIKSIVAPYASLAYTKS